MKITTRRKSSLILSLKMMRTTTDFCGVLSVFLKAFDWLLKLLQNHLVWPTAAGECNTSPRQCTVQLMLLNLPSSPSHLLSIPIAETKRHFKRFLL